MQEKEYYTIGEVSRMLGVDQHVVRFWGDKFSMYVKPVRKSGLRRHYRQKDIEILMHIKDLLYTKRMSIPGALLFMEKKEILDSELTIKKDDMFKTIKEVIISLENIRVKIDNTLL